MSNKHFDAEGFYMALEGVRLSRSVTWKWVALKSGVAASTLTRMGQGKKPDVDGLAALASWAELDVSKFYRPQPETSVVSEPLAEISALLRADRNLSGESAKALDSMLKSAYTHMRKSHGKK